MLAVTAAISVLAVPATASAAPSKNIVETAAAAPQFSTLVSLVERAGLAETLSGKRQLTVFAPTNAAFDKGALALQRADCSPPARRIIGHLR
jgi:uncharacterized surface protein with fasciclin (FAS1) repeats